MPGYDPVHELNALKTENDQLKRALRNSEERFGQVLEGFSEAVWETNAQGVAVKDSVTWRDYTGQTIEEWLGHGWVHAVHLEDREFVELEWRKALLSGRGINVECRLQYVSGRYHWARVRAVPVSDADGRIEKWFGMVYDIDKRKRTEESLRTSEEKYRTLFNSIDEGFFVIDVLFDEDDKPIDIYYVEANTAATKMLGNDYAGKRLRDISPDYEEYWYQIFGKVALTGQSVRLERYAGPDKKWYSFYVFRIGGPESRRIGNTFQDITEHKKADEALIRQWRLMQRIMDELPVAVSIVQGNDLRIQYTNPAFRIMAPDMELVGRTTTQAMSGGQPHIDNVLLEVLTTGETYTEIDQPYPVVRSPKSHRELAYFTSSVSRILMPDANWGLLITFVETTGRKSIEEELRRSKDELELRMKKADSILNSITDSYFELDKEWRFISVNDNALNHFGRSKEEVIGQSYFDVLPQAGGSVYEDQYTKVMAGSEAHFEVGSIALLPTKWFEIHAYPSDEEGISVYFRDITERKGMEEELRRSKDELEICVQKRTEELRQAYEQLYNQTKEREAIEKQLRQSQKMEAIGTLAGGIAHDFNNILAGIIGFAEMVEEDLPLESKSRKYIQRVLKASERGKDLVRQILTFSRKTDLKRTPVSLKNLIKETRHLLRASIPSTIEIEVDLQAKNDNVLAAPAELQQVLMNLVTNAVAAMKDKGGTMTVSTADHDLAEGFAIKIDVQPGPYIQLSVTDTGVGIPAEIKDKIFEPFFTTKEVGQGTGMGLAVVYAIVRNLGGNVTVESTEGVGSVFNVFLPVATVTSHETARTEELPRGDESILFVDDEDTLASWGEDVLQRLGYTVTAVTDPRRALSLFSVEPFKFDIVILDQTMPKLTGFDLAKKMLEIRADLPIILCTGHSDIVSEAMAKNAGIREFLMKPVGKKSLADAIRMALK